MLSAHEQWMQVAIAEAERARGGTGDNPWVGCVITSKDGVLVARGHTRGPGEDHAEIVALAEAKRAGVALADATLYSTLEPCAFHGRTPACARAVVAAGVRRVVVGMLDPHPRVDGEGLRILRDLGAEVVESVCEDDVRRQLGEWVFTHHPHEPLRRARALLTRGDAPAVVRGALARVYAVPQSAVESLLEAQGARDLLG